MKTMTAAQRLHRDLSLRKINDGTEVFIGTPSTFERRSLHRG